MIPTGVLRVVFILLLCLPQTVACQEKSAEEQIRETLRALPEALRHDATVLGYEGGERRVLKAGTGAMICVADDPSVADARGAYFVNCFPQSLEAFENRRAQLSSHPDWMDTLETEVRSGHLPMPDMAIRYTLRGANAAGAVPLAVLQVPFATAESAGLSTVPNHFRPWMMDEGTVMAHVMLPGH